MSASPFQVILRAELQRENTPRITCLCCGEPPRTEVAIATTAFGQELDAPIERRFIDTRGWVRVTAEWTGRAAEAWICGACFGLITNTYGAQAFKARMKASEWYRNSPNTAKRRKQ